jgi:hypothetical protein
MSNINNTLNMTLHNIYKGRGYIDTYSFDIFITFILCLVFFVAISYFHVINNIKPIIADWNNQKCSPAVIPFAGMINKNANTSALEFTAQNFSTCLHTMVSVMAADAVQPINYIINGFTTVFDDLKDVLNDVRAEFDKIRTAVHVFTADVMGRTLNITMPVVQMFIVMKTMVSKVIGALITTQFTLLGAYLALKSIFTIFLRLVNDILIAIVVIIVASFLLAIFFPPALEMAIGTIVIMTLILVPSIIIQNFVSDIFDIHTSIFPSIPSCFAADTLLRMADGSEKKIADVGPGDILENTIKVTATLKCSAQKQKIYRLDGVTVTGEHRVFHTEKGWIKVKDHEDSQSVEDFCEPFVYCLNTTSKTIQINNTLFSDWDDVDETVTSHLENKCVAKGILPKNFKGDDINIYLENGLDGDVSFVKTLTKGLVALKDIQVNDILDEGQRVVGIVKIDMSEIETVYDYSLRKDCGVGPLEKTFIRSSRNLQTIIVNLDENILLLKNWIEDDTSELTPIKRTNPCFYQLLVEGGRYKVNEVFIGDYNTGLDKFLL